MVPFLYGFKIMGKEISLTIFNNIYDNQTNQRLSFNSFQKFKHALIELSKKPGYKLKKGEYNKKSSFLISPAIYKKGTTRSNSNVEQYGGFLMIDIDKHDFGNGDIFWKNFSNSYPDIYYLCYSTPTSSFDYPKCRIVIPTNRWVEKNELNHVIFALNQKFGNLMDKQTKDVSRMFYIPGQYPESYDFFYENNGFSELNINSLLEEYPYTEEKPLSILDRLDDSTRNYILSLRKSKIELNKASCSWSSYKDCPFINKQLVDEYRSISSIDNTGRYAMIYKIMVSIASLALKHKYPINEYELVQLVRELDRDTANRYQKRKLDVEASRAIEWAYRNTIMH